MTSFSFTLNHARHSSSTRAGIIISAAPSISTLSVIGVGVPLAVCLKGAKIEKSRVISTLQKLKEILEGLQMDLRAKCGPLSAL